MLTGVCKNSLEVIPYVGMDILPIQKRLKRLESTAIQQGIDKLQSTAIVSTATNDSR